MDTFYDYGTQLELTISQKCVFGHRKSFLLLLRFICVSIIILYLYIMYVKRMHQTVRFRTLCYGRLLRILCKFNKPSIQMNINSSVVNILNSLYRYLKV